MNKGKFEVRVRFDARCVRRERMKGIPPAMEREQYVALVLSEPGGPWKDPEGKSRARSGKFDADDFAAAVGLDIQDGDEILITACVNKRVFSERRTPKATDE